ncbi:hypothetical protein DFH29DRAFT_937261, partial [Suillus ampliporus]
PNQLQSPASDSTSPSTRIKDRVFIILHIVVPPCGLCSFFICYLLFHCAFLFWGVLLVLVRVYYAL